MIIRIVKGMGWYNDKVGEKFEVIRTQTNRLMKVEFVVYENSSGYNWVDEDDCEIVET